MVGKGGKRAKCAKSAKSATSATFSEALQAPEEGKPWLVKAAGVVCSGARNGDEGAGPLEVGVRMLHGALYRGGGDKSRVEG